jgi:hypothetical protein
MVELGDKVRDRITKFEGVCTAITKYINGCRRIVIQPEGTHDGKPIDSYYVDEPQCEVVEPSFFKNEFTEHKLLTEPEAKKAYAPLPGGPPSTVAARKAPKR